MDPNDQTTEVVMLDSSQEKFERLIEMVMLDSSQDMNIV